MQMKAILAALATATLMTGCIVTPDDHINQPSDRVDPGYSRPPAHDHGGLQPGETMHDRTDPGYNRPSRTLKPGETIYDDQTISPDSGFGRPTNPDPGFNR